MNAEFLQLLRDFAVTQVAVNLPVVFPQFLHRRRPQDGKHQADNTDAYQQTVNNLAGKNRAQLFAFDVGAMIQKCRKKCIQRSSGYGILLKKQSLSVFQNQYDQVLGFQDIPNPEVFNDLGAVGHRIKFLYVLIQECELQMRRRAIVIAEYLLIRGAAVFIYEEPNQISTPEDC